MSTGKCTSEFRILLVEDNKVSQELCEQMLKALGYPVEIAENGLEALDAVTGKRYDLILMDCQLPEMDGYKATSLIRKLEQEGALGDVRIPVVALTAHAGKGDRENCLAAGMDDYLSKPFTLRQLGQVLERWLSPACAAGYERETRDVRLREGPDDSTSRSGGEDVETAPAVSAVFEEKTGLPSKRIDHKVWNEIRSLQGVQGTPDLLALVFRIYLESTPPLMQRLRNAVEQGNGAEITRLAHSLKSANGNIGALILTALCRELEARARAGRIDDSPELLNRIEAEYGLIEQELERELRRGGRQ